MSTQCSVKAMGDVVSDSSSSVLDLAVPQKWLFWGNKKLCSQAHYLLWRQPGCGV